MGLRFWHAPQQIKKAGRDLIVVLPVFAHIDPERTHIIFSNSKSKRALAYCHEFSKRIQFALGMEPHYVIEVILRQWNRLERLERAKVLIHELNHIPRTFSGALRDHNGCFRETIGKKGVETSLLERYLEIHPIRTKEKALEWLEGNMVCMRPEP